MTDMIRPMGRRKTVQTDLPPRMRRIRRAYYYDHGIVDGKRWREPLGSDYPKALKRWAEIEAGTPADGTIGALIDLYRKEELPKASARTREDREAHLILLDRVFGRMEADSLEPHHIATFLRKHSHPVAANRQISTLSQALSCAYERGLITRIPTRGVRRNPEKGRHRRVTEAEYRKVYALAPPVIQVAMELAVVTGMRRGDLLALSWSQVDDDQGIFVEPAKTKDTAPTAILLEWTPRLRAAMDRAKSIRPKVRGLTVLCRRDGSPYTADGFSAMWQRVMRKAVRGGIERFTFHDLRAKCATDAAAQGLDSKSLLGHQTERQHQTYLRSREVRKVTPL